MRRVESLQAQVESLQRRVEQMEKQIELQFSIKASEKPVQVENGGILTPEETSAMVRLSLSFQRKHQSKTVSLPSGKVLVKDDAGVVHCFSSWPDMQRAFNGQQSHQSVAQHDWFPSSSQVNDFTAASSAAAAWQASFCNHNWDANAWLHGNLSQSWHR